MCNGKYIYKMLDFALIYLLFYNVAWNPNKKKWKKKLKKKAQNRALKFEKHTKCKKIFSKHFFVRVLARGQEKCTEIQSTKLINDHRSPIHVLLRSPIPDPTVGKKDHRSHITDPLFKKLLSFCKSPQLLQQKKSCLRLLLVENKNPLLCQQGKAFKTTFGRK